MNFSDYDATVDSIARRFEDDWRAGKDPRIEDYLPVSPEQQRAVFWELLAVELELRLSAGQEARLEDYTNRIPKALDDDRYLELIETEFRLRTRREPGLRFTEYLGRFPGQATALLKKGLVHVVPRSLENAPSDDATPSRVRNDELPRFDSASRFRFVEPYREGGLGKVWIAHDKELDRAVAIKEIRDPLVGDDRTHQMFVREATTTAQLQHPGIVPVYGLGSHVDGRPFYAMKLVEGRTLAEVVEELHNGLDAEQSQAESFKSQLRRLIGRLIRVCQTVEYAHSQRVLHRDLKPSNIMLGKFGETVVLDWGMLKVGDGQPSSNELLHGPENGVNSSGVTTFGRALGSPAYMSPEQARGDHDQLGPATDIYSLGGTLLTILTGRPPVEGRNSDAIIEKAKTGEIQWSFAGIDAPLHSICRKAMATSPHDRYESAAALATDLESYLAGEQVAAHRETWQEKFSRVERKHRGMFRFAGICLLATAIVSMAAAFWAMGERRAAELSATSEAAAKLQAQEQVTKKQRVLEYLVHTFGSTKPLEGARDVTVASCLDAAVANVHKVLADDAVERALLLHHIGGAYKNLGNYPPAIDCAGQATRLFEESLGPDDDQTLAAKLAYGTYLAISRDLEPATEMIRQVFESRLKQYGDEDERTQDAGQLLGGALNLSGHAKEAIQLLGHDLAIQSEDGSARVREKFISTLANAYQQADEIEKAVQLLESVVLPIQKPLKLTRLQFTRIKSLASFYNDLYRHSESEALMDAFVPPIREAFGAESINFLVFESSLVQTYCALGRFDEAEEICRRHQAIIQRDFADSPLQQIQIGNRTGFCMAAAYRHEDAIDAYGSVVDLARSQLGTQHLLTQIVIRELAKAHIQLGQHEVGLELLDECLQATDQSANSTENTKVALRHVMVRALISAGRIEAAETILTPLRKKAAAEFPDGHRLRIGIETTKARLLMLDNEFEMARELLMASTSLIGADPPMASWVSETFETLIECQLRSGNFEEAKNLADKRLVQLDVPNASAAQKAKIAAYLAEALLDTDPVAAADAARKAMATMENMPAEYSGHARTLLGRAMSIDSDSKEAEEHLLEGFQLLQSHVNKRAAHQAYRLPITALWIAEHYDRVGNSEESDRWRQRSNE